MTWIAILQSILQLAVFFARLSDKRETEQAVLNELEILQGKRVREAAIARDDVIAGRVPIDPDDPNRRD